MYISTFKQKVLYNGYFLLWVHFIIYQLALYHTFDVIIPIMCILEYKNQYHFFKVKNKYVYQCYKILAFCLTSWGRVNILNQQKNFQ